MHSNEQGMTHRSDILHDGELELILIFCEEFPEVLCFVERSDNTPDSVAFLQEDINDVDGEEPICTGDEDLISWGDSRHDSQSLCGFGHVENDRGLCGLPSRCPPVILCLHAAIFGL